MQLDRGGRDLREAPGPLLAEPILQREGAPVVQQDAPEASELAPQLGRQDRARHDPEEPFHEAPHEFWKLGLSKLIVEGLVPDRQTRERVERAEDVGEPVGLARAQRGQASHDQRHGCHVTQPAQPSALPRDSKHLGCSKRRNQLFRDGRRVDFRGTCSGH